MDQGHIDRGGKLLLRPRVDCFFAWNQVFDSSPGISNPIATCQVKNTVTWQVARKSLLLQISKKNIILVPKRKVEMISGYKNFKI